MEDANETTHDIPEEKQVLDQDQHRSFFENQSLALSAGGKAAELYRKLKLRFDQYLLSSIATKF